MCNTTLLKQEGDIHSLYSTSKFSNLYSSASTLDETREKSVGEWEKNEVNVEKRDFRKEDMFNINRLTSLKENDDEQTKWVSPVDVSKKRWPHAAGRIPLADEDPFGKCPDSSFDLNSSLMSLDFGLISPKRNWSSPPQRIERAQNREWSPHRVIDRPNPENSPGNWVSVKEFCQQSPPTVVKHATLYGFNYCPTQEPRSMSQNTYAIPERTTIPQPDHKSDQPSRKTSVLMDYVPDRRVGDVTQPKKRPAPQASTLSSSFLQTSDKVKRVVDSSGRVVKISLLEDYQVPSFTRGMDKVVDDAEKNSPQEELPSKAIKRHFKGEKPKILKKKTTKLSADFPEKKEEVPNKEKTLITDESEKIKETKESEYSNEKKSKNEINVKDFEGETKKIMTNLENILKDKPPDILEKEKGKSEKPITKKTLPEKVSIEDGNQMEIPVKKKRNIDTKGVQEFIRNQKQKRLDTIRANKKTKVEEREAIKKNLEELRVRTLKLVAAQSKKKKETKSTIKIVDPGIEDDITMSLGLKQIKPKVSYNESVLNLKKMTPRINPPSMQTINSHEEAISQKDGEVQKISPKQKSEEKMEHLQAQEIPEVIRPVEPSVESTDLNTKDSGDINMALKKLAEVLNLRMSKRESELRSLPSRPISKTTRKASTKAVSEESTKTTEAVSRDNRPVLTIDVETIQSLKQDIKKISDNFKTLYEIIVKKSDFTDKKFGEEVDEKLKADVEVEKKTNGLLGLEKATRDTPFWLQKSLPKPHPYSVYTAICRKMNIEPTRSSLSVTSQESSSYIETVSNRVESDFEALSLPSDRLLPPAKQVMESSRTKSTKTIFDLTEGNCLTLKDSGSELSSSIWDSEKHVPGSGLSSARSQQLNFIKSSVSEVIPTGSSSSCKDSGTTSTVITEITSKNIQLKSEKGSLTSELFSPKLHENFENLALSTPNVKLMSTNSSEAKLNSNKSSIMSDVTVEKLPSVGTENKLDLTDCEENINEVIKTDSVVTEITENLNEDDKPEVFIEKIDRKIENAIEKINDVHQIRRTFFQPQMLHLQFQAELTLLETFQRSLSNFLEAERMKTLSEVTKIVYEKAVGEEKVPEREDQAVQTTFSNEELIKSEEILSEPLVNSIKTESEISEEESTKKISSFREISNNREESEPEVSEKISQPSGREICSLKETPTKYSKSEVRDVKNLETPDFSNEHNKISFQMLERMLKDEELRSEHQLALIKLREKTLNDKVKAELTFLEMKKRALKESKNDEEHNVSAIKKRQRGILMKYQSEKEEIERLKKMHKIASDERKIMIKQQRQIQQMQLSTKDMLSKLSRKEKSPFRKNLLKPKVEMKYGSQSDIPEDLPVKASDTLLSESIGSNCESSQNSHESDLELSSKCYGSDGENGSLEKHKKIIEGKISNSDSSIRSKKSWRMGEDERGSMKRHSIDELISWTKRLEEKENRLNELERKAIGSTTSANSRMMKSLKNVKTSMKDRSTSPFQFAESLISQVENSVSINEVIEVKNSSTISGAIPESIYKVKSCEKTDDLVKTVSEDISIQFFKTESRNSEYYSESFESPSSYETQKFERNLPKSKESVISERSNKSIPFKLSLSPRIPSPKGRYSSGSDDSQNFSHTETASEQSDLESRIVALREQLRRRKLEAEKLRREQKKVQRERLKVKEQSLLKQIQAYDAYIQKKKQELEKEYEHSSQTISKPLIKQPKIADKNNLKPLNETEKIKFYSKVMLKSKEKEEAQSSPKVLDSDSEIQEHIVEMSEKTSISERQSSSIFEQIKSKVEEEEVKEVIAKGKTKEETESQVVSSVAEGGETSLIETSKIIKTSDPSTESVPKPEIDTEESLSGSDDRSASIKTMVLSLEKQDAEIFDSGNKTDIVEEESKCNKISNENTYLSDSFESDFEEKSSTPKGLSSRIESDRSEILTLEEATSTRPHDDVESENEKIELEIAKTESEAEKECFEVYEGSTKSISSEVAAEDSPTKIAKAQMISDSLVSDLLTEAMKLFSNRRSKVQMKKNEESEANLKISANAMIESIIVEVIEDVLKIYKRKIKSSADDKEIARKERETEKVEANASSKIVSDVRKRICEIITQTNGVKDQRRPQDMMVTTYDVIPGDDSDLVEKEKFIVSLNQTQKEGKTSEILLPSAPNQQDSRNEIFGQEWFDDDYGLSQSRREAEQLRIQQLQIEQEIQQLQAQREQIPYYYLREIPNKPPPPYTPPGKPLSEISTSESDVVSITDSAVQILMNEMKKGKSLVEIEPTQDFFGTAINEHVKCYKTFLFDLARHLIEEVLRIQDKRKVKVLPWHKVREPLSVFRYSQIERTTKELNEYVRKRVVVLFEFGRKANRESFMMRCFKKKRDHVDEILVCESQEEESQWTQFDEEQVAVKNEVTLAILDGLLLESAQLLDAIFRKKMKSI